jgi:hypothetical protein
MFPSHDTSATHDAFAVDVLLGACSNSVMGRTRTVWIRRGQGLLVELEQDALAEPARGRASREVRELDGRDRCALQPASLSAHMHTY